jgi:hypothetical protein
MEPSEDADRVPVCRRDAHRTAASKDCGYDVFSALALAVEAAEALCRFLSDC